MGTKNDPGLFDCYNAALPDEETFTLNARDPDFRETIQFWCNARARRILSGEKPASDQLMILEAEETGRRGADWRAANMGKWRGPQK